MGASLTRGAGDRVCRGGALGVLAMAKAFTIALWILTPACFYLALGKSPVPTGKALIEITPLWVAAFAAVGAGLSVKSATGLGLIPGLILESTLTLLAFAVVALLLAHRRSEYRRMAATTWALVADAVAQRRRITL